MVKEAVCDDVWLSTMESYVKELKKEGLKGDEFIEEFAKTYTLGDEATFRRIYNIG